MRTTSSRTQFAAVEPSGEGPLTSTSCRLECGRECTGWVFPSIRSSGSREGATYACAVVAASVRAGAGRFLVMTAVPRSLPSQAQSDTSCGSNRSDSNTLTRRKPRWGDGPRRHPHVKKKDLCYDNITCSVKIYEWSSQHIYEQSLDFLH